MADVPTMRVAVEQAKYLPSAAFAAWCDPPGCQGQYPLRWNPSRVDQPRCCSESVVRTGGGDLAIQPWCREIKPTAPTAERATFECSAVDPAVCDRAIPGGVGPTAVEVADQAVAPRGVFCVYDMGFVAMDAEATDYYIRDQRVRRADPAWYDEGVMTRMCGQGASPEGRPISRAWAGCPQDSAYRDGNGRVICSNLVASPLCKAWATEDARGKVAARKIAADWCAAHTDAASPTDPAKTDPACIGVPPPPPPPPPPSPDPVPDPGPPEPQPVPDPGPPEPRPVPPPPAPPERPPGGALLLVGGLCIAAAVALLVAMRRRE
jgi:hypothetical protein